MNAAQDVATQLAITARLLDQGRRIDLFSIGLTLIACALAGWAALQGRAGVALAWAPVAALGLAQRYLALRVGFDAALFAALAEGRTLNARDMPAFDRAMQALALLPADKAGRGWTARCAGAKRLLGMQGACAALQLSVCFVSTFYSGF